MDLRPIGVFDSGLGGLTAVRRLRQLLPGERIVFLGDTKRIPYGGRSADTILRYAREDMDFLLSQRVRAVLAACGTVSSLALEAIRGRGVPVVGVVEPAARRAAGLSPGGRVAVCATEAAVRAGAYAGAVRRFRPEAEVLSVPCPKLVPLIESGHTEPGDPALMAALGEYLAPVRAFRADTLILGCTHYPLAAAAFRACLGGETRLVDAASAAAEELARLLEAAGDAPAGGEGSLICRVTGSVGAFAAAAARFLPEEKRLSFGGAVWNTEEDEPL